jgi:hypothetical protein
MYSKKGTVIRLMKTNTPITLKYLRLFSKFLNNLFLNRWSEFLYLFVLSLILSGIYYLIMNVFWSLFLVLLIGSLILTVTTVRLSNVCIYSRITKHLSMMVQDLTKYHNLDYIKDKRKVAQIFQEEFIQALENAHKRGYRTIKMTTHAWLYHKVCLDERVTSLFEVKAQQVGTYRIPLEVILLVSPSTIESEPSAIFSEAYRPRIKYKVKLIRKI